MGNMRGMHFGLLVRITSLIAFIEQREVGESAQGTRNQAVGAREHRNEGRL